MLKPREYTHCYNMWNSLSRAGISLNSSLQQLSSHDWRKDLLPGSWDMLCWTCATLQPWSLDPWHGVEMKNRASPCVFFVPFSRWELAGPHSAVTPKPGRMPDCRGLMRCSG